MPNLKYVWSDRKYLTNRKLEHLLIKFVWKLPRKVVCWSAVRVISNGTSGEYRNQIVPELTAMDALRRWDND